MKHHRQVIREKVASILAPIGITVHRTRIYPYDALPAISVYVNQERATNENSSALNTPARYTREAELVVEVLAEAVTGVDDTVDDYVAQVEAELAADLTLDGTVTECILERTAFQSYGDGEKPVMSARLSYRVWYRTTAADPETAI
jgi:hypothetical protein